MSWSQPMASSRLRALSTRFFMRASHQDWEPMPAPNSLTLPLGTQAHHHEVIRGEVLLRSACRGHHSLMTGDIQPNLKKALLESGEELACTRGFAGVDPVIEEEG